MPLKHASLNWDEVFKIHRRSSLFSSINEMAINIFWIDCSSCMIFNRNNFFVNWKLSELISVLFWIHERIYPIHENSARVQQ